MRSLRVTVTALFLVLSMAGGASQAAGAGGSKPRIVSLEWTTRPLTAGAGEQLEILAVDPDSVVTTVNVLWGDGMFTHADLICFDVGEEARVLLRHRYARAGVYQVRVVVRSGPRCFTTRQTSPEERIRAFVRP